MKITEENRALVRAERERGRQKMSEQAKRKLREQKAQEKITAVEQAERMREFAELTKDVPHMKGTLQHLLRHGPPITHLERMARKLLACLESGLRPSCLSDITFFAALTPAEEKMGEAQFEDELERHARMKHRSNPEGSRYSLEYKQARMRSRMDNFEPIRPQIAAC